ncbi:hypothetical protein [Spirosoma foliorum]|uniref:Uncharacterized protein n=1 Tax=Spirosoma foliorum TaxID=2710596 RepID=A0A7G5H6G4_9BACT|nr:hypothetical protein [Spirosoma foliorum]QMW06706.1 hypothetical protein H3H32_18340 [Spirosoma foliorum]
MAHSPLYLNPTYQRLHQRVIEIEDHLRQFENGLAISQIDYQQAQSLQNDPGRKSTLLETHTICQNRQMEAIKKMKVLYQKALNILAAFETDWKASQQSA